MTEELFGGDANALDVALARLAGEISLGTLHEQKFYAVRAKDAELRFPFPAQPFTAMVDMTGEVDDAILKGYAAQLMKYGCVQCVCRGEEAARLSDIFDAMAELGEMDASGAPFTAMCVDDEPLNEAIEYFVLPSGLASVGLLLVIGGTEAFQGVVQGFFDIAGTMHEAVGEPVYTMDDLVCFAAP